VLARAFCCNLPHANRLIVALAAPVLEKAMLERVMAQDQSIVCKRVVIDDRSRLPGRFFGRFATSATSRLVSRF